MKNFQMNKILGYLYIVFGLILFFLVAWNFLIKAGIALIGLYFVSLGFKMQGYPVSRFLFMAQQWRSRF
ncbi:hypothetical protein KAH94_02480 [bacterium]|nr:hypothetical protein [bacterium]